MKLNLNENFVASVERFRERIAIETRLSEGRKSITYGQLGEKVKNLAFFMSSLGIGKADNVAIILENSEEWVECFFAISFIGAVAVPVDSRLPQKDVGNILYDSGAKHVFIRSRPQNHTLKGVDGALPLSISLQETAGFSPRSFISKGNQKFLQSIRDGKFIPLPAGEFSYPDGFKSARIGEDDLAVILYTSGTTDQPKGVMLTHKNLCANFDSLNRFRLFLHKDAILSILPLYHSFSLMTTLILPVFCGAKIVYVPPDWPEKLVTYLKEEKITIFIGVPQIFHSMHRQIMDRINALGLLVRLYIKSVAMLRLRIILPSRLKNAFGKDFRFFASGGAKLDETVTRDFLRLGFRILEGYGLTETSPVVSFNPLRGVKAGSVGKAIPDVKIEIINKDINGIGEIAIKGPNVTKGYYKDEVKTRNAIKDGWFLSGDLGYLDKDRYLYITGRSKEQIVLSSGKNIYPEEIEKIYSASPYVKELCVLGVLRQKGPTQTEYLHAVVVPDFEFFKERGDMNIRKVIGTSFEAISRNIASYKHITGFTVTQDALPRTVLGKIKRYEVEKTFMERILNKEVKGPEAAAEEKILAGEDTAKKLIECIKNTLVIKTPVSLNDSIELDLGVDSLGRVELILAVEKYFDIDLPEEMASGGIFTVKDLLLKIEEAIGEQRAASKELRAKGKKEEKPVSWPEMLRQPLPPDFEKKILLKPSLVDYIFAFLIKSVVAAFFRFFYNLKIEGAYNIPRKGPYVLCVNHTSFLDGFIVAAGVPLRTEMDLFFIGFRRYFIAPIVRNMVRRARIIPIDATQIKEAMQASFYILKHNKALCIFPEGERSIDGELKDFKKGIGIITEELRVRLLPVFIKGAFEAWPRTRRLPRMHPIRIKFGNPVSSDALMKEGIKLGAKDSYEAISVAIREELIKLKISENVKKL